MSADTAKTIRNNLKAAGYNSRKVSVRSRYWGSVSVEVKDLSVDFRVVSKVAKAEESISRCEMTHEILSGGNTFVSVSFASGVVDSVARLVEMLADTGLGRRIAFGEHGAITIDAGNFGRYELWHVPAGDTCGTWKTMGSPDTIARTLLADFGPGAADLLSQAVDAADPEAAEPQAEVIQLPTAAEACALHAAHAWNRPAPQPEPAPEAADLAALEQAAADARAAVEAAQAALAAAQQAEAEALRTLIAARRAG